MRHPIIKQIEKADKAIVAEGFDTLMYMYTRDAVLVASLVKTLLANKPLEKRLKL